MSITEIGANSAQESSENRDANSTEEPTYDRYDLNGVGFGKQHPPTAVRGEIVALRKLWDENDPDRSDIALILEEPSIVNDEPALENTVVALSDEQGGDDFKIANLDDENVSAVTPEGKVSDPENVEDLSDIMAIEGNNYSYYGDVGTDFGDLSTIALKRGGGAGRRITSVLDVRGAVGAESMIERENGEIVDMELGEDGFPAHNGGLIEYDDSEDNEMPRYARDPQLRDDVEGKEIIVMLQRLKNIDSSYSGGAFWATIFVETDEDDVGEDDNTTIVDDKTFVELDTTDEFEPDEELVEATGWIEFGGINRNDSDEIKYLNQRRVEEGFNGVYVPDGMTTDEAVPDDIDVVTDYTEDDRGDDETITPFGAGAPDPSDSNSE